MTESNCQLGAIPLLLSTEDILSPDDVFPREDIFGSCLIEAGVLAVIGCSFPKALKALGSPISYYQFIILILT
ncbi:MAG TPA: hypothetical protein VE223_00925 [Nitrososphaeraceae archaeon]|nr:hypothetical protein [Nitrososphaeraceae archaeon]